MTQHIKKIAVKKHENWWRNNWRSVGAAVYFVICLYDFVIGPTIYNILQFYNPGQDVSPWVPLTTSGGGLVHLSFGSLMSVSAFGRTREKLAGVHDVSEPMVSQPQYQPSNVFSEAPSVVTGKFGKIVPQADEPVL